MYSSLDDLIEVTLPSPDKFLVVMETLTRIGIASNKSPILYQSCHILHKKEKYYIVHFKELFRLDGKPSDFSDADRARRNTIANLLHTWGLVTLVDLEKSKEPLVPTSQIKIISHGDKPNWVLESKYKVGNPANRRH